MSSGMGISRRQFMSTLAAAAAAGHILKASEQGGRKSPNILWLIAEDFGPHLGCYGTKEVFTPNIDRLATEGVRYTRFYTTAPVCSPSRSAFMTGMYATTIGAHNHRSHRDDGYQLPAGVHILPDMMRKAGYFTANIRTFPEQPGIKGTGKTDWNFTYEGKPFDSDNWNDLKMRQPFYAQVNFKETHRKFGGQKKADPAKVEIPPYYPDHPVTREDWAAYLDDASELDRKIGLVLAQLETDGLADNTIVVFFGDNGQAHVRGKQFCYESGLHVPMIIRWPKSFPAPKQIRPGLVDERLLASIDLAPTMLSIAGARPEKTEGTVFIGDQAGPPRDYVFGARDRCDETAMRIRTVRDRRYRYIRNFTPEVPLLAPNAYKERQYPAWNLIKQLNSEGKLTPVQAVLTAARMPDEELFDIEEDPHETNNLAKSQKPEHQETLKRLRAVLEKWIKDTDDKGQISEPPEVIAAQGATKEQTDRKKGKKGGRN